MQTLRIDISTQRRIVDETRREWRTRQSEADARGFLNQNPNIAWDRSILVSIVYEAYRLKLKTGEAVDDDAYVREFPELGESLRLLIQAGHAVREGMIEDVDDVDAWPAAGEVFADFLLVEELGRGAFARAFLALEGSMSDRPVVVKIAREAGAEAGTLAQLRHTNIVPVHSTKRDDVSGFTALCMPFYGRATLHDLIQGLLASGPMPTNARRLLDLAADLNSEHAAAAVTKDADPILHSGRFEDAVVWMGAELSDALEFAHEQGVFHGDVKPANVLIDRHGHPLLFDFNLARTEDDDGGVGGTLAYMAPEQLALLCEDGEAESLPVSASSVDVFSLGATLYEALSGQRPFDLNGPVAEQNPAVALLNLQRRGPRPLSEFCDAVDPTVAAVIQSCLAFDPAGRPASAGELGEQLRLLLRPVQQISRQLRRHPRLVVASLSAVCVLVLSVAIWLTVRPPYHERQYQVALGEYSDGNYSDALPFLENALESSSGYTKAFELRALVRLRIAETMRTEGNEDDSHAEFLRAKESLEAARQTGDSDPHREELMAYCNQRCSDFPAAAAYYNAALQMGLDTAELRNNLGVLSISAGKFLAGREHLDSAIRLNPNLQAPWFNRATLELAEAVRQKQVVTDQGVSDIETAVLRGRATIELHITAAYLHARTESPDIGAVVRHLKGAAACGLVIEDSGINGIAQFAQDRHAFRQSLENEPEFRRLRATRPTADVREKTDRVLRPSGMDQEDVARIFRSL